MGISIPKSVDSEGENRSGGGGGGASANASDWVELSLDPADSSWTLLKSGNANNVDCTLSKVGNLMVASMPTSRTYNLGGTTNNAMHLISSVHIDPWSNHASGGPPIGTQAQTVQPEAQVIKLEVTFDDTNGPWNEPGPNYGSGMRMVAGFASWQNDQGGSPAFPGWIYRGAMVRKAASAQPSGSTSTTLYRAGYVSYFGYGDQAGATWSNQQNATSAAHNAIVFELGIPLRRNGNTGQNWTPAGSYSTTNPFGAMIMSGYGFNDNSTPTSNPASNSNFFHFWLSFGAHTSGGGTCKISRIRFCIQPVASRVAI